MRADLFLFTHSYFESRSKAADAIKNGYVKANGNVVDKPSAELEEGCEITVSDGICPYVSRGGLKLEAALDFFEVDVNGMSALDIGASTGGFTDCLLTRGASKVTAVDTGTNQLHRKLLDDERITSRENVNARNLSTLISERGFDIAVADVSFISQTFIIPEAAKVLKNGGVYIGLIKPQFEAGRAFIGKNGIVRDKAAHMASINRVLECACVSSLSPLKLMKSPVSGGDGNTEYLFVAIKNGTDAIIDAEAVKKTVYSK